MSSRTTEAYVEVLLKLMELVPEFHPEEVLCDFEGKDLFGGDDMQ